MKKTRFLILSLAVAIMLMGAGYAYWNETLTIENTVTTGKLDFTFQNPQPIQPDIYMQASSCVINAENDNQVDISLGLMYPGAEATVQFDLANTGTMKAIVKDFTVTDNSDPVAKEYFQVKYFKVGNQVLISNEEVLLKNLASKLAANKIILEPEQVETITITFAIDTEANEEQVLEGQEGENAYHFSIEATGYQYNHRPL